MCILLIINEIRVKLSFGEHRYAVRGRAIYQVRLNHHLRQLYHRLESLISYRATAVVDMCDGRRTIQCNRYKI